MLHNIIAPSHSKNINKSAHALLVLKMYKKTPNMHRRSIVIQRDEYLYVHFYSNLQN